MYFYFCFWGEWVGWVLWSWRVAGKFKLRHAPVVTGEEWTGRQFPATNVDASLLTVWACGDTDVAREHDLL